MSSCFPSRTDTFGLVLLEALASGVPVAAFPVTGPRDVIGASPVGVLDDDLRDACLRALELSRASASPSPSVTAGSPAREFVVGHVRATRKAMGPTPQAVENDDVAGDACEVAAVFPYRARRWMTRTTTAPVTPADIDAAAETIAPVAVRTPLLNSAALDERVGARVFLKPEVLQRTGSFKFRGAYNKLSSIPNERRAGGVVAFSSGNHAQGVAAAARLLDMPATIVMPADAPVAKRERTKSLRRRGRAL